MNIITCWQSDEFFRSAFEPLKTWKPWFTPAKLMFHIPLKNKQKELFKKCTKRKYVKGLGFDEGWFICPRRTGKSRTASVLAAYCGLIMDWKKHLAPGEYAYIYIIAVDRKQARGILDYCKGLLSSFQDQIEKELTWEIWLKTRVIISVQTASFKTSRGRSVAMLIMDEAAFFQDENSANPAEEILTAILPSLMDGGKVIGLSTPFGKFGLLYNLYKEHFGKNNSDVLVWQATDAKIMRPNYSDKKLERMRKRDPIAFRSEYEAQFRDDLSTYLSEQDIEQVTAKGGLMRPPISGVRYYCFVDPSGGKNDSFCFCVGRWENGKAIIDRQEEFKSPFSPSEVVSKICETIKLYGVYEVVGDRYAGMWPRESFQKNGINYKVSELDKNEIFLRFQAYVKSLQVELLDSERLKVQLQSIQRKAASGGREIFIHGLAGDDLANVIAGCCCGLLEKYRYTVDELLAMRKPVVISRIRTRKKTPQQELEQQEMREILSEVRKEEIEEKRIKASKLAKLRSRING